MRFNERLRWTVLKNFFFPFSDPHQKDDINKKAFDKFKKEHGVVPQADNATPSERFEGNEISFFWVENANLVSTWDYTRSRAYKQNDWEIKHLVDWKV